MKKCPACKTRLVGLQDLDAYKIKCTNGCYEFISSHQHGFFIRIGEKEMNDLYEHSISICRKQNIVLDRWKRKARKQYLKGVRW